MSNDHSKTADAATVTTWLAWVLSDIAHINEVLQFLILVLGVISGVYALAWHMHRWNKRE